MAIVAVLLMIYIVPFPIYGAASRFAGLKLPEGASPGRFLLGVLVTKLGIAVAFVVLFYSTRSAWGGRWPVYAALWFAMFALSEAGEAISGRVTRVEAIIGVVSEAVYTPLAAFVTHWLLGRPAP